MSHEARVETVARILGRGGWRDEDGVRHKGITVRDWSRAADIVAALDDLDRVRDARGDDEAGQCRCNELLGGHSDECPQWGNGK
jgi:hypothetical protein